MRQRRHCGRYSELHLRSIKVVPGLDVLRCQTPAMVRKELWMGLLADNVIRALRAAGCRAHAGAPHRVSFKGALQTLLAFAEGLREGTPEHRRFLWSVMLRAVAADGVGHRPDRVEPRAVKRRPRPYPLLMVPRDEAEVALLNAG